MSRAGVTEGADPTTEFGPYERRWGVRDCIVYALGVGSGVDELQYATDGAPGRPQRVIPTFMINQGMGGRGFRHTWIGDPERTVHAGHRLVLHNPYALPTQGSVRSSGRITEIVPKRSGRLVTVEWQSRDAVDDTPVCENTISYFVRDPTERRPSEPSRYEIGRPVPDGPASVTVSETTLPSQALLYRCSGDPNVIHTDPEVARAAGFRAPILHGLCTLGFAARALLRTVCDDDPTSFRSLDCRFANPGYPGDVLTTEIWTVPGGAAFRTSNQDGTVLVDRGLLVTGN